MGMICMKWRKILINLSKHNDDSNSRMHATCTRLHTYGSGHGTVAVLLPGFAISKTHGDVIKWKNFPRYWPHTRSFDVFVDVPLHKRLGKQSICWWFETPLCSLWRHHNAGNKPTTVPWPDPYITSCYIDIKMCTLCLRYIDNDTVNIPFILSRTIGSHAHLSVDRSQSTYFLFTCIYFECTVYNACFPR